MNYRRPSLQREGFFMTRILFLAFFRTYRIAFCIHLKKQTTQELAIYNQKNNFIIAIYFT